MGARLKSSFNQSLSIGWQAERFRREGKGMKALAEYLKAPTPEPLRVEQGARDLRAMLTGRKQRQKPKDASKGASPRTARRQSPSGSGQL